jgi:hypothetical protein
VQQTPDQVADEESASPPPSDQAAGAERVEVHHKHQPVHGGREFLKEVGIIVLGVLIALGAEQSVEALHWSARAREAEVQMRKELTEDDGPQAYQRLAKSPCIAAQLNGLEAALLAERDRGSPFRPSPLTEPTFYTWDSDAYRQATASSALSHMSAERAYAWSSPYTLMADMDAANIREAADYAELAGIASAPQHPSEPLRERLLAVISRARGDNALLTLLASKFVHYLREPGVTLTDAQKRQALETSVSKLPACNVIREQ